MIRATGTNEKTGQTMLVLGLSEGNLNQLRKGNAIHIFGQEMNLPIDIVIFWGETEDKLAEQMKPLINKQTLVRDRRKAKKQ